MADITDLYARPDSIIYRAHYVQQRRKKRKGGVTPIPPLETRIFNELDSALNSYYSITTPVTLSSNFEVEVEFQILAAVVTQYLPLVAFATGNRFIRLNNGVPQINFTEASNGNTFGSTDWRDGKLHTLKLVAAGLSMEMFMDGVSLGTQNVSDVFTTAFDFIGRREGAYFIGILSNVKLTNLDTATVTTFALDTQADGTQLVENSLEGNNSVTYNNIPAVNSETFELTNPTLWTNISPDPKALPTTIEVA